MRIGAHVSNKNPLAEAAARGADIVQFFLSNPQGWRLPADRPDTEELRSSAVHIYIHAPYLINISAGNTRVRHPSRQLLQRTCNLAVSLGAAGVVVHGGYCDKDEDPSHGFRRWRRGLEQLETEVPVLIENTAGGVNAMCREFDVLARLWEAIDGVDVPLGFCFDTCHAHSAGEALVGAAARLTAIVGRIDLVHCNDSKDSAGSGRDRHENLGKGRIDPEALLAVVREAGAPVIVETPGGAEEQAADIAWIRERL
ncbi:MAG: deoxyribonuclease IV [Nitriliruptorales bacterium]